MRDDAQYVANTARQLADMFDGEVVDLSDGWRFGSRKLLDWDLNRIFPSYLLS